MRHYFYCAALVCSSLCLSRLYGNLKAWKNTVCANVLQDRNRLTGVPIAVKKFNGLSQRSCIGGRPCNMSAMGQHWDLSSVHCTVV